MTQISDKYAQLGGAGGFLGSPLSGEQIAANGGLKQEFQHGSIYWHPTTGAYEVHGAIRSRWLDLGAEGSEFGYPVSDETVSRDGVGRFSEFQGATVLWHPATGAFEVHGLIRARWRDLGAEISPLGYPTNNETVAPDGFGRYNHFEHGSIFWSRTVGRTAMGARAAWIFHRRAIERDSQPSPIRHRTFSGWEDRGQHSDFSGRRRESAERRGTELLDSSRRLSRLR